MVGSEQALGLLIVITFMAVAAVMVGLSRLPEPLKLLFIAALLLRGMGAYLRYTILFDFYGGTGDAMGYYTRGWAYAQRFLQLDFSPFYEQSLWFRGRWWGTSFISFPTGIVLSVIGPSVMGGFVAFSLLAFAGLAGFAIAFHRSYPDVPLIRYARWIWLFPSLWYWPSTIGKDAVVLLGIGLAVWGFVGRREKINWLLLGAGMFLVFGIRPQVAAVALVAFMVAYLLPHGGWFSRQNIVQTALIAAVGLGGIWLSMSYIGVDGFDVEGVQDYIDRQAAAAAPGRSSVGGVGTGLYAAPFALVNVLARPFPWEARNPLVLLSGLETLALWAIVWYRRRNLMRALRGWRSDRLLRVAVPFILLYATLLGMIVINLGIIARQRIFLFPFLFLLLEAPDPGTTRSAPHRNTRGRNAAAPTAAVRAYP